MQRRRWVAIVAVLAIVITSLSFFAMKVGSRHPAVRRAVLSRVIPEVDADLSIGELTIGLASLTLGDVDVDLGARGTIHVPEAAVSLSYRKLLLNGLEARRALASVIIVDPTLTLRYGLPDSSREESAGLIGLGPYLPDYMGVSGATVTIEDARTGGSATLEDLDLQMTRADDSLVGSVAARFRSDETNLSADIEWDTVRGIVRADGELVDADLAEGLPLPPGTPFDVVDGTVYATAAFELRDGARPAVDARYALSDGVVALSDGLGEVGDVSGDGTLNRGSMSVNLTGARWAGGTVSGRGDLDLGGMGIDGVELALRGLDAAKIVRLWGGDTLSVAVSGALDADVALEGAWAAPAAEVTLRAADLVVGGTGLADLLGRVSYAEDVLTVQELRFGAAGGEARLSGQLARPGEDGWALELEGDAAGLDAGALGRLVGRSGITGRMSLSGLRFAGSSERMEAESLVRWSDVVAGPVSIGSGAGGFMLRDDVLTASLSDSAGSVALSSRIESVSREPSVEAELVLSEVRAASLPASPGARAPDVELTGTLSAEGPIEGFSVGGSLVVEGEDGRASVSVDGIVGLADGAGSVSLDVRSPDAVLRGVELPFSSTLRVYGDRVAIQSLEVDGLGEARLALSRRSDRSLSGSVVVSEARLQDVLAAFADVRAPQSLDGLVFASLSLAGSRDAPRIEGQVQIGNGSVMGVDGLSAVLAGRLEDGIIHVDEMALQHDGDRVLNVEGTADLDGDVAIIARGSGIPGPLLMGDDGTRFSLRLGVGGDRRSPTLDAVVEASDGAFLGVPFDDFLARVTGAENVLRLNPLSLEKRGAYRARAEGTVPWSALSGETASDEATMTVEVDGDPLALLAGLTSAVESGSGSGSMQVVLAGSRGDVSVAAASLEVSDGTIVPAGVIERVDDVEIEVRVADGRLTRGVVSGTVGGERIALERAVLPSPQPEGLESLSVAGIDVGILALSTGEDGVRASVPGLMLPEDIGRIVVRGEDGVPALLIGGPSERPSLRGELVFSDVSFTYPLLESEEGVGGFLASADWALRMTAGRNLWYWRPDANLQIVRGSTLEFRGVPDEGSLCVSGRVESQRGSVTYANTDFDVREASVDFPYFCGPPRFYVLAETRVDDGTTISLTMDSYEEAFAAAPGATFDESELRLSSDSPDDDSREDILSKLQYGMSYELLESEEQESLERRRALEVVGSQLSGRIVRPLLSPVEGRIKRALDLDLVRFEIDFVQHFLAQLDLWQAQEAGAGYQPFLTDTRITLGKYISRKWMFSYVGRADAYEEELGDERLGFSQELGIEYEVSRNTSLSLRVVYDPALAGWDRRVTIENRFRF